MTVDYCQDKPSSYHSTSFEAINTVVSSFPLLRLQLLWTAEWENIRIAASYNIVTLIFVPFSLALPRPRSNIAKFLYSC
jgi:hypothetical protein